MTMVLLGYASAFSGAMPEGLYPTYNFNLDNALAGKILSLIMRGISFNFLPLW